jgi:peptidoglycan/xylan/chitin deacetylase (PgdA/CDA1 family)
VIKRLASSLLAAAGLPALYRRRNRARLPILMYHGVVERPLSPACWHQLDVGPFRRQIAWIAAHYRVLPLEEALDRLYAGTLPERACAITFDDGFRNNLEVALPILEEFRAPATVFLVTDLVGTGAVPWPDRLYLAFSRTTAPRVTSAPLGLEGAALGDAAARAVAYGTAVRAAKELPRAEKDAALARLLVDLGQDGPLDPGPFGVLSWDDVARLTASGLVSVASHTRTHQILSRCADDEVRAEVGPAHEELARRTGRTPRVMAYPVGRRIDFDARAVAAVEAAGIPYALTTIEGLAGPESDRRRIPRLGIGQDLVFSRFRLLVSGALEGWRCRR